MIVTLLNPAETIKEGGRAKLGDPVALKLGELGARDMVAWNDGFLIIAGRLRRSIRRGREAFPSLFVEARTDPQDIGVDFGDLNPEAIVIMGQGDKARILILSDDGKRPKGADQPDKSFRGVWLQANAPTGGGN